MQLSFDAADRLVELVQARHGPVAPEEAARTLFALERAPAELARSLLDDVVAGDSRLVWLGTRVGLAGELTAEITIEDAELVVFDLETTGLSAGRDRMCEIGAVRVFELAIDETFETLVNPGTALPRKIASLTGIREPELRLAPSPRVAVTRFLGFAGDAPLVAHNARFDVGFLDREVERLTDGGWLPCGGHRVARPPPPPGAERALPARAARALLRHLVLTVPPGARRRARDRGDPHRPARPCAGARRADGR